MSKKTEVKCDGIMLTAGFHAASPPLIWRFDLQRNHSFTLALQGEEGDWDLGLTSPKGEFHSVVHFLAREDAEEAFTKIEKVLQCKRSAIGPILKALLVVGVLAFLIFMGITLFVHYIENRSSSQFSPQNLSLGGLPTSPSNVSNFVIPNIMPIPSLAAKPKQEGEPESADDILQPPP